MDASQVDDAKSTSKEMTFSPLECESQQIDDILRKMSDKIFNILMHDNRKAKCITLKMKTTDFDIITRAKTLECAVSSSEIIYKTARELMIKNLPKLKLRLIGNSMLKIPNN